MPKMYDFSGLSDLDLVVMQKRVRQFEEDKDFLNAVLVELGKRHKQICQKGSTLDGSVGLLLHNGGDRCKGAVIGEEMCPHSEFDVIYYEGGVLLRRCRSCGQVEMRTDWIWCDIPAVVAALAAVEPMSENPLIGVKEIDRAER